MCVKGRRQKSNYRDSGDKTRTRLLLLREFDKPHTLYVVFTQSARTVFWNPRLNRIFKFG